MVEPLRLAVSGDGVVSRVRGTQKIRRGLKKVDVPILEKHTYHAMLIVNDDTMKVEGALITDRQEDKEGDTTYQLVEVSRLQLSSEARPAGDSGQV